MQKHNFSLLFSLVFCVLISFTHAQKQTTSYHVSPSHFKEQEISFNSTNSATLHGILTLPSTDYLKDNLPEYSDNKRVPVVVLVQTHDQHPLDRNSSIVHSGIFQGPTAPNLTKYDIQPFRDIAHYLADRGIASLRYDSRDCFKDEDASCSNIKNPLTKDSVHWIIDDLSSAIKFLATKHSSDVDMNHTSIACHHTGCFAASHVSGSGVEVNTEDTKIVRIDSLMFLQASLESQIDYFVSKGEHHMDYLKEMEDFFDSIGDEDAKYDYAYKYELAKFSHSQCIKIRDALHSENSTEELKKLGDITCWTKHVSEWEALESMTKKGTIPKQLYNWTKLNNGNSKLMVFNSPEDAYVTPSDYQHLHSFVFTRMQAKATPDYLSLFGRIYIEPSVAHWLFPADYSSNKVSYSLLKRMGEFLCNSPAGYQCIAENQGNNNIDDGNSFRAAFATISSVSFLMSLAAICGLVYVICKIQTSRMSSYHASRSSENDAYRVMTDEDL